MEQQFFSLKPLDLMPAIKHAEYMHAKAEWSMWGEIGKTPIIAE